MKEGFMAGPMTRDKAGRPVVAITGMGVVTSLGVGKSDNWAKLTAGASGIRRISRFPLDSMRTTIAGTANDVYKDYMPPAELSKRVALLAGEEAIGVRDRVLHVGEAVLGERAFNLFAVDDRFCRAGELLVEEDRRVLLVGLSQHRAVDAFDGRELR
jgi:hypothetical protein